jgi:hypothetical protein
MGRGITPERFVGKIASTPKQSNSRPICDVYFNDGKAVVIDRNKGKLVTVMGGTKHQ